MSFFNPEYQFTCQRCGCEWYMTKREIKEAHIAARNARSLKIKRTGFHTTKTYNNLTSQIAVLERTAHNDKKCPACGSTQISKTKLG